jgi:Glyoxalase-like domain
MSLTWMTAFLDLPAGSFDAGVRFWQAASGSTLSPPRGEYGEFATLLPRDGDALLRVQRLGSGPARIHLDLHTDDPGPMRAQAELLGAAPLDEDGVATYASPGGLVFCVVTHPASQRPRPVDWGTHRSAVDQVCIDIPAVRFDREAAFWSGLLDRPSRDAGPDFARLAMGPEQSFRVLLQRIGDEGPVRAHLDLATPDREPEVERLRALGAEEVRVRQEWTTLRDPAGLEFCVTDRDPDDGLEGG